MAIDRKYSKPEALKLIRKIVRSGAVIPSSHVKLRMLQRNFDMQDVVAVLKNGAIYDEPEIHPKTGRWTYTVEGKTLDGKRLHVCTDMHEKENKMIILTGMID